MRKFIKMLVLFSCSIFIFNLCFIILYIFHFRISTNDIPAPNISDSYSFNEKMEFLRKTKMNADIVAIGSSMSLINLYSNTITDELHSTSFLNTASWGMSMKDDFLLLKILTEIHKPTTIIIGSNIVDFSKPDKKVDYSGLKNFLISKGKSSLFYHIKYFNLKYYFTNFSFAKKVRSCTNEYEYLGFDKYGTVSIDSANFKIDINKWNNDNISTNILPYQYSYLDSVSSLCKSKNIKLLFFQSPYRNGLYSTFDQKKINYLKSHTSKIETILKKNNHSFINTNDVIWADQLFLDGIHFNKFGAKRFTEYCFLENRKFSAALSEKSKQRSNLQR